MSRNRVLYIGTPFFNYYKSIILEFEKQGYMVDYYNDRPSENSLVKGLIKVKKNLVNNIIQRYFEKIISETKEKTYDLVFIVNCKVFTPQMIKELRETQKSARFVLYMWDSLTLYPNSRELIPIFDKAYSFDLDDCEKIKELIFLPLFYSREFEVVGNSSKNEKVYDLLSICTAHPNRYKIISGLFPKLESSGVKIFSYMYLNKMQYLYNKLLVPEFKHSKSKEFKFKPLSVKENIELLRKTSTVFDMQHNKQSGLTMRTIETLGAKRKLITTNTSIKKYDFYNENNIYVMEDYNIDKIKEFINKKYSSISEEVYNKYSLKNWIETIINEEDNEYIRK